MNDYRIVNKAELDQFLWDHRDNGCDSITGTVQGATYSDGSPVVNPMNVAWVDRKTGERFDIVYGEPESE